MTGRLAIAAEATAPVADAPDIRRPLLIGALILVLFVGGFFSWAFIAQLRSGAIAPGIVVVDGSRKTVQHLEGGIVGKILVGEGDKVVAGQPLVRLDDIQARARVDMLRGRQIALRAEEARLTAERDGRDKIAFPADLLAHRSDAQVTEAIAGQDRIFRTRIQSRATQEKVLIQQIRQFEEEVTGLRGEIAAEDVQLRLIEEEVRAMQTLVKKRLASRSRLLALQREAAEISGARSRNVASIARAQQNIGETQLRISELETSRLNETLQDLRKRQVELLDLDEQVRSAKDVLTRTDIHSPIAGTVVGLKIHTAGGIISPGSPLMDIVPSDDRLIVEAQIDPGNIDELRPQLGVQVRLTALPQRDVPPILGKIISVSADRLVNQATQQSYYLARIALIDDPGEVLPGVTLHPGMQAEVIIVTGERHPIDYLLKPLFGGLNRALREK